MSRLDDLRLDVDAILTAMAQGYQPIGFVGEYILPAIPAPSDSVKYPVFGKESFMIPDTVRALRAMPVEVDFTAGSATAALEEHSTQAPVDRRELAAGAVVGIDYRRQALMTAKRAVALGREQEMATLLLTTSNYDSSHVVAASNKWDTSSGTPVEDILAMSEVISDDIGGAVPNTLTLHRKAWNAIKTNPNVLAFATETIGPIKKITTDIFAQLVEVEKILVTNAMYTADGETFSGLWTSSVVHLCYTATATDGQADQSVPSFGFNLRRQYGTAMDGELPLFGISGSFNDRSPFVDAVWYMEEFKPVITLADAGGLLTTVL